MLVDVSKRNQQIELFGQRYDAPFGISPVGLGAMYAYRGDLLLAGAAARANIPAVLSGASLTRLEDVAQAAPGTWFQAYMPGDAARVVGWLGRVRGDAQADAADRVIAAVVLDERDDESRAPGVTDGPVEAEGQDVVGVEAVAGVDGPAGLRLAVDCG